MLPNWHPLFVHFTVGLLSTAVLFYLAGFFLSKRTPWKQQWLNMANWCLWTGCLFAIATTTAGWFAYNSVAHDTASHTAMTLHRNWALPTATIFLLIGLWAIILARKARQPGFLFLSFATIAAVLLMITGWLGAEAVYRYGLGVKSLPIVKKGADGHNHSHHLMNDEINVNEHSHSVSGIIPKIIPEEHQHDQKSEQIELENSPKIAATPRLPKTVPESNGESSLQPPVAEQQYSTQPIPGTIEENSNMKNGKAQSDHHFSHDVHEHNEEISSQPLKTNIFWLLIKPIFFNLKKQVNPMKLLLISFFFIAITACSSMGSLAYNNESLKLIDGSSLFIEGGNAVRIVDRSGEIVPVKKGAMMELANGNFIYVNKNGSVDKIKTESRSHKPQSHGGGHTH